LYAIFLDEFAKTLDQEILLIMDNADWHSGLSFSSKVQVVYLSLYSPKLNPVEKLWQYIKSYLQKNKNIWHVGKFRR